MNISRAFAGAVLVASSALIGSPPAAADVNSFYGALHAQGITSERGDQALFNAGTQVCKDTALYIRIGGDWGFFGARRKAAENLVLDNLQRPRNDAIILANTAIDQLCPQYSHTWSAV